MATAYQQIGWETSWSSAQQRAAREGKAALLDFSAAPECKGCVAMEEETYPDQRVAKFIADHIVPVRVVTKDNPQLVDEFLVVWTPTALLADERGNVHYRVEGFLPPEEFLARLSLGMGKYWLAARRFAQARQRFEEVSERHVHTEAAAEALYWLGVVQYKQTHDLGQLRSTWRTLTQEYSTSEWATRARIPGMT